MFPLLLVLLAHSTVAQPFEIYSNKPFVQVKVNGSAPLSFILDTGNNAGSIIARECAERLKLERGAEARFEGGAGSGADVNVSAAKQAVHLEALGDTMTVAEPRVLTLGHVSAAEGRRCDGLLGFDFHSRHVIEIDYARSVMTMHDPESYTPPAGAIVVPLNLDTGWPIARGSIAVKGGTPIPCDLLIDTGVRFTLALFRPFSEKHKLYETPGTLHERVIGSGAAGLSHGDLCRVQTLTLGSASFANPIVAFSRDTSGVFSMDGPDGILGGEVLRRHRVTFDYPHQRMILEPYPGKPAPFENDMSGMFLGSEAPEFRKIRVLAVNAQTPAAEAKLQVGDEIVSIDGRTSSNLTLDQARALLREPVMRRLEVRRGTQVLRVRLAARRMV